MREREGECVITSKQNGLNANQLKWIAIVAMTCDHLAFVLLPETFPLNVAMRLFGKFTFPIMCFFVAEGYRHTHSLPRYAARLGVFALLSHIPYVFFMNWAMLEGHPWGTLTLRPTSVIFTLLCGLLALAAWENIAPTLPKLLAVFALCALPVLLRADWGDGGVLLVLAFGVFHGNRQKQLAACLCASVVLVGPLLLAAAMGQMDWVILIQFVGFYLALLLLGQYNGRRGGGSKWLFYCYYPLHLLVIAKIIFPLLWPLVASLWG